MKTAVVDIDAVAAELGLSTVWVIRPIMPDAPPVEVYDWQPSDLPPGLEKVRALAADADTVHIAKVGNRWVLPAAACAVWPAAAAFVPPFPGAEPYPLPDLSMGDPAEAGGIRFSVERQGTLVTVDYLADDPERPPVFGPHNYDIARLPQVVVPSVEPEDEVFFGGNGQFPVLMAIARAYCGKCRSLSVLSQTSPDYVCIWSEGGSKRVGDVTPGGERTGRRGRP